MNQQETPQNHPNLNGNDMYLSGLMRNDEEQAGYPRNLNGNDMDLSGVIACNDEEQSGSPPVLHPSLMICIFQGSWARR